MNNSEICKRIAEIDGFSDAKIFHPPYEGVEVNVGDFDLPVWEEYNPLTDDALCFKLIVKYRLEIWEVQTRWFVGFPDFNTVKDDSLNKAICLAIIEAYGEVETSK